METLLVPRDEVRQILVDLEKFIDLGLWAYFFSAIGQLEQILGEDPSIQKNESRDDFGY